MIKHLFWRKKPSPKRPPREKPSAEAKAERLIAKYLEGGRAPWSPGYHEFKWQEIGKIFADAAVCRAFAAGRIPDGYGIGLDERVVEYPWIFPLLLDSKGPVLDGGSILNFEPLIRNPLVDATRLTIAGLAVEKKCFYPDGVSYQLCDLRDLPFRDGWFETTLCISTLEHIGMNNEIYGHADETAVAAAPSQAGGGHLDAVAELVRVTSPGGTIAISVPVGRYESHGFFHQFDRAMIDALIGALSGFGAVEERYFRYRTDGWKAAEWSECEDSFSHNPRTGIGQGDDGAAHCRAVGCFLVKGRG
jgi:hypothetical protein